MTGDGHRPAGAVRADVAPPQFHEQRRADTSLLLSWHERARDGDGEDGGQGGAAATAVAEPDAPAIPVTYDGQSFQLRDGSVVIAAITSCTNTSNPSVLIGAGLLAKKAVEAGLARKPWVKTSLAPGSRVVRPRMCRAAC